MSQRRAGRAGGAYVQRHPTTGERIEHYVKRLGVVVEQVVKHFGRDVAEMLDNWYFSEFLRRNSDT